MAFDPAIERVVGELRRLFALINFNDDASVRRALEEANAVLTRYRIPAEDFLRRLSGQDLGRLLGFPPGITLTLGRKKDGSSRDTEETSHKPQPSSHQPNESPNTDPQGLLIIRRQAVSEKPPRDILRRAFIAFLILAALLAATWIPTKASLLPASISQMADWASKLKCPAILCDPPRPSTPPPPSFATPLSPGPPIPSPKPPPPQARPTRCPASAACPVSRPPCLNRRPPVQYWSYYAWGPHGLQRHQQFECWRDRSIRGACFPFSSFAVGL